MKTLLIGGARSGKSALAEDLARRSGREVLVVATAEAGDAEMQARIAAHRAQRPAGWTTLESALGLAARLREVDSPARLLLVDCLTLWLSNCLPAAAGRGGGAWPPRPPWQGERQTAGGFRLAIDRCFKLF